jgi:hypothetical protein
VSWTSDAELDAFVVRFCNRTLAKSEWTHAAHLAVGTWHVHHYGVTNAVKLLRERIQALNASHGTPNTDSSGYHETITCAYAHLIDGFLAARPGDITLAERVQVLLASPVAARDALLKYYSRDLLLSVAARREWKPPDLMQLPGYRV